MTANRRFFNLTAIVALSLSGLVAQAQTPVSLLNVSADGASFDQIYTKK